MALCLVAVVAMVFGSARVLLQRCPCLYADNVWSLDAVGLNHQLVHLNISFTYYTKLTNIMIGK